jgi:hypothetical protein
MQTVRVGIKRKTRDTGEMPTGNWERGVGWVVLFPVGSPFCCLQDLDGTSRSLRQGKYVLKVV